MGEQADDVSVWHDAQDVLKLVDPLRQCLCDIAVAMDSPCSGTVGPDDPLAPFSLKDRVSRALALALALETLANESRFSSIQLSWFSESKPAYEVRTGIVSVFSFAGYLVTECGLGRFNTPDYPVGELSQKIHRLVSRLKDAVSKLEALSPAVGDYLHSVARERLKRPTSDSGGSDFPTPPGTSFVVVKYLAEYVGGGEWPVLCVDDLFADDLAIIQQLLQQELDKRESHAYTVTVRTEASLSRKDFIATRIKWKDISSRASHFDFSCDPFGCAYISAKQIEAELRSTDPTGVSQLRLPLAPREKYYLTAPLGATTVSPMIEPALEGNVMADPETDTPKQSVLAICDKSSPSKGNGGTKLTYNAQADEENPSAETEHGRPAVAAVGPDVPLVPVVSTPPALSARESPDAPPDPQLSIPPRKPAVYVEPLTPLTTGPEGLRQIADHANKPKSRAWCHDAPPGKDSVFTRGPIDGKLKEVEAALDMRWPTIKGKQNTAFFVVDIKKGKYAVYFQHQQQLAEASKRLEEFRTRTNAQQPTVTRKTSKKEKPI
jgi:hypothetical protein